MLLRALIGLSLLLSGGAMAQAPDLPVINGGIYVLRPLVNVGLCLEVQGAGTVSGSLAGTWDFLEADHQRWRFLDAGSGFWHLEPVHAPGKRLEVASLGATNGSTVRISDANSSPQQKWLVLHQGGGAYRLLPMSGATGCLTVQDAMTSRGARVHYWQISAEAINQLWKFDSGVPVLDNATYYFCPGGVTNAVLEVTGSSPITGAETRLGSLKGGITQKWLAIDEGWGWWSLAPSTAPNLRLEVPGGTNTPGIRPRLATRSGAASQNWRFHRTGDGLFVLQPQCAPSLCLLPENGATTTGTPVQLQNVTNLLLAGWNFLRIGNVGSPAVPGNFVQVLSGIYRAPIDVVRTNFLLWLDRDRLLYPYYRHGGLPYDPAKTNYGGWFGDASLDVAGMWLSAAARSYVQGGPETNQLKADIDYLVSKMAQVQDPVTGRLIWPPAFEMEAFQSGSFYATNPPTAGSYWYLVFPGQGNYQMQWYWWEKILGGLLDAYRYAGNAQALTVATRNAGYVLPYLQNMPASKCQEMLKVDGGNLAEHFAMLGQMTARADFQNLARKLTMETNLQAYADGLDTAVGQHGNTTVPRFTGAARVYQFRPENYLRDGADNFFTKMVRDHCYAYGGLTDWEDISDGEPLGTINTEGCVTHQMCRLARNLSETGMRIDYAEYIENATLNQLLGEYDENGSSTYYNSCLPGHLKLYGSRDKSFWCCTQRGWDDASRHAEYIYSAGSDTLWVNLFVDSRVRWWQQGLTIRQSTQFPVESTSLLTIESGGPKEASLKIRVPRWVRAAARIQVNSESPMTYRPGERAHLRRVWTAGDNVAITLPMGLRFRASRNATNQVTFFYGPVMLAGDFGPVSIDDHLQGDPRAIPTPRKTVPMLTASALDPERVVQPVPGEPLTFVTRPGVLRGGDYGQVTLRPYYGIIHRHHNIYWDLQTSAGPVSNGVYRVIARHSGKALEVASSGTANGANVQQRTYSGGANQHWVLTSLGSNQYQILGLQSGRILDVSGQSTADGANVNLWDWLNLNNQKWALTPTDSGYYRVTPVHSSKSLDVSGGSTAEGADVFQWTYLGGANQQWMFIPVAPDIPATLGATAGVGRIHLEWSFPLGAGGFELLRSTNSGGPYFSDTNTSSADFTDTSVANGTTYYYVVRAFNGAGMSGLSLEASATPRTAPRVQSHWDPILHRVVFTWPDWAVGWRLLCTSNLAAPVYWSEITNSVLATNGLAYVDVAPEEGARRFFRLGEP